jgi:hypothetical protein
MEGSIVKIISGLFKGLFWVVFKIPIVGWVLNKVPIINRLNPGRHKAGEEVIFSSVYRVKVYPAFGVSMRRLQKDFNKIFGKNAEHVLTSVMGKPAHVAFDFPIEDDYPEEGILSLEALISTCYDTDWEGDTRPSYTKMLINRGAFNRLMESESFMIFEHDDWTDAYFNIRGRIAKEREARQRNALRMANGELPSECPNCETPTLEAINIHDQCRWCGTNFIPEPISDEESAASEINFDEVVLRRR